MANPLVAPVIAWLSRLRHPQLFALISALFLLDLVVPDFVPFLDEILLGLGAAFLARWKRRHRADTIGPA